MLGLKGLERTGEFPGLGKSHHLLHELATYNSKRLEGKSNEDRIGSKARSQVPGWTFLITIIIRVPGWVWQGRLVICILTENTVGDGAYHWEV